MLFGYKMMMHCEPVDNEQFRFDVNNAPQEILNKAIQNEEAYIFVNGKHLFVNIDEMVNRQKVAI